MVPFFFPGLDFQLSKTPAKNGPRNHLLFATTHGISNHLLQLASTLGSRPLLVLATTSGISNHTWC